MRTGSVRSYLHLVPIAVGAAVAISIATKSGVGLSPDSTSYIGAARAILSGKGISLPFTAYSDPSEFSPMTAFPPLYSLTLASLGLIGVDPLAGARVAAILLFSVNVLLVGVAMQRYTHSTFLSALGSLLALLSTDLLQVHSMAWSEPLFICLLVLMVASLGEYLSSHRQRVYLTGCSICGALLLLTRYAGVWFILGTGISLVILGKSPLHRRIKDLLMFGAVALMPTLVWFIRNRLVSAKVVGRGLSFNPDLTFLQQGLQTVGRWFFKWDHEELLGAVIIVLLSLLWLIVVMHTSWMEKSPGKDQRLLCLLVITWPLVLGYIFFLFVLISFSRFDGLDSRILSPAYVLTVLFGLGAIYQLLPLMMSHLTLSAWVSGKPAKRFGTIGLAIGFVVALTGLISDQLGLGSHSGFGEKQAGLTLAGLVIAMIAGTVVWHKRRLLDIAGLITVVVFFTFSGYRSLALIGNLSDQPAGYSAKVWQDSELIKVLNAMSAPKRKIYSNGYDVVYIYLRRPTKTLPLRYDPFTLKPNPDYQDELSVLAAELGRNKGLLVYFDTINRDYFPSEGELLQSAPLRLIQETADGRIYETNP